jgi:ubiquinone biosynthesis protein
MSIFGEIRHDLGRLRQIARVASRHGFAPALRRLPVVRSVVRADDDVDATGPAHERFCRMLEELGPTFVKLGQILSTRGDLLPPEFTGELSRLQDQVPPFSFEDARLQVEQELGRPLEELFATFDETPLASASMAQVHAATLESGDEVVVKVQRPGIDAEVRADSSILVIVSQLLEAVVEEASTYQVHDLAQELEIGLAGELDFALEARNLRAFKQLNDGREGVHVPRLYDELSGRTVMTMERLRGVRITDLAGKPEAAEVVERLVMLNYDHIFVDGVFHADPHPGNVLYTDDGDIGFIDFGLMGRLARDVQDRMITLMMAVSLRDSDSLARLLLRVGDAPERVHLYTFRDAISRLLDRYLGLTVAQVDTSQVLADLVDLSTRYGIRMPRELALLSKTSVTIDGIMRVLHPDFDPSVRLAERAQALMLERLDPRQVSGGGLRAALQAFMLVQELPMQLSQAMYDLERGQLQVSMVSRDLSMLDRNIRGLGMTVFGGLIASASLLGGMWMLARYQWELWGVPVLPAVAFLLAGSAFGISFTWFLTGGRVKKISASRLVAALLGRRREEP